MPTESQKFYKNPTLWVLFFISIFIFNIVNKSPIDCASSDSRWTLLASQSLIENGTMRLDKYADLKGGYTIRRGDHLGYAIEKKNGHLYNFFPLGSSLSSLPFVWLETQVSHKLMKIHSQNKIVQKRIAATVAVGIFLLLYLIASLYLATSWSIVVALGFWSATSLSSILGQGLWSHTFAIFYALLSFYFMLKIVLQNRDIYWIPLGVTLFMAYLSRPTFSLLSITVIAFLFFNRKKIIALKTALVVFALLGLFVLYSMSEFGQLLPSYYMPKRLSSESFWIALYANTLSPSRGVFVFSPFLLLFFIAFKESYRMFRQNKTLLVILGWVVLHSIIISKFPHWSGGWCYGSRFMSDILPAIYLLFVVLLLQIYQHSSTLKKRWITIFLLITVTFSITIHIPKGLYEKSSAIDWHRFPSKSNDWFFDWEYPQFLHTEQRQKSRLFEYKLANLEPLATQRSIRFDNKNIILRGWAESNKVASWSIFKKVTIDFTLDTDTPLKGILRLKIGTLDRQEIGLYINGHPLEKRVINSWLVAPLNRWDANLTYRFDPNILNPKGNNRLTFNLPNAHKVKRDRGDFGIALKSLEVE